MSARSGVSRSKSLSVLVCLSGRGVVFTLAGNVFGLGEGGD